MVRSDATLEVLERDGTKWEKRSSHFAMICRECRCQIEAGDRYYWNEATWVAYHRGCALYAIAQR